MTTIFLKSTETIRNLEIIRKLEKKGSVHAMAQKVMLICLGSPKQQQQASKKIPHHFSQYLNNKCFWSLPGWRCSVFLERNVLPSRVGDHQSQAYHILPWQFNEGSTGELNPCKANCTEHKNIKKKPNPKPSIHCLSCYTFCWNSRLIDAGVFTQAGR